MNTTEKNAQKPNLTRSLREMFGGNVSHYNNVNMHMLKNAMGTQQRAKALFASSDLATTRDFLKAFDKLNADGLVDKDGKVNAKKLKSQTSLLRKFYVNTNNLLVEYLPKTISDPKAVKTSQAVVKNEFKNEYGDGMVDVVKRAGNYLAEVEAGQAKEDKAFVRAYAEWVKQTISDLKNNYSNVFENEIAIIKAQEAQNKKKAAEKKKEQPQPKKQQSTALITKEMADDIDRIRQISVGNLIVGNKGVKRMEKEINVSELTKEEENSTTEVKDTRVQEEDEKAEMLVDTDPKQTTENKKEKKSAKVNAFIAAGLAGAAIVGGVAGAGIMHHTVDANQKKKVVEAYKDLESDYGTLQGNYNTLDSNYNTLDSNYNQLLNDYNELKDASNRQTKIIEWLRGEYDNAIQKVTGKQEEIDELRVKIAELEEIIKNNDNEGYIAKLRAELQAAYAKITRLERDYEKEFQKAEEAQQRYEDLLVKYERYKEMERELKDAGFSSVDELLDAYAQAVRDRDDYYQKWQDALKNKDDSAANYWKNLYEQKANELSDLQNAYNALAAERNALLQQVQDLQNRISALEAENEAAQSTSSANEDGSGASQMSTGNNDNTSDDTHVNNNGMGVNNGNHNRGNSDDDLSRWETPERGDD